MNIHTETVDGVVVLSPSGRIDSNTAAKFEAAVTDALVEADRMILDFTNVPYVSSAGLRVVLIGAKQINAKKGKFALCGLSQSVMDVFELSGFANILHIAESREAAMKSMSD